MRIFNVNTRTLVEAVVQTPNGVVQYEGTTRIDSSSSAGVSITCRTFD